MSDAQVHGHCDTRFAGVREVFANNLKSGIDVGASFAVTVDGEMVVDLWGGFADQAQTQAWARDTIVNVYSTTKTMTALATLLLADRGVLDLHAPVARYWPEFAANDKAHVKVSHLLSHSAGLAGWDVRITPEELYDWDRTCALLAAQKPWWTPGEKPGYHALSQGFLVGEVIRRASGKTVGTLFREEIAGPLGADFHIGLSAQHDQRVGQLIPPVTPLGQGRDPQTIAGRTLDNPTLTALEPRTRGWRAAEIPAAGGIGNARSVAEVQTVLANRGVSKGKRIMSEAGTRRALEPQIEGTDLVLGLPVRYGMGYGLPGEAMPLPSPNSCFWGGWGGSLVIVDQDRRACFAYVMNKMGEGTTGDLRAFQLIMPIYQALAE
ncbi:MAG: beta-lactamase family protein [Alphaproteobacteria bacterium]|nr:beta-lactamase family protein [Alphaproteobacteria bacterium]